MRERFDGFIHALEAAHFALAATLALADAVTRGKLQEADEIVISVLNQVLDEEEQ